MIKLKVKVSNSVSARVSNSKLTKTEYGYTLSYLKFRLMGNTNCKAKRNSVITISNWQN